MSIRQIITVTALVFAAALGACAQRSDIPVATLGVDDDALCRAKGFAIGSNEYVACRKDRDVQRSNATTRADRAQRNLGETMLNNPEAGSRR